MGDVVTVTEQAEVMGTLIDHPIIDFYTKEVQADSIICSCDDYEVCDYDAS